MTLKKYPVLLPPTTEVFSCPYGILTRLYEQLFESQMRESEAGTAGVEHGFGPRKMKRKVVAKQVDY